MMSVFLTMNINLVIQKLVHKRKRMLAFQHKRGKKVTEKPGNLGLSHRYITDDGSSLWNLIPFVGNLAALKETFYNNCKKPFHM